MNRKNLVIAPILLCVFLVGVWFFKFQEAGKSILVAGDDYQGYAVIRSEEMRKQAKQRGLIVSFTPKDKGNYADRLERFAKGEYQAIVLPVSSWLQHGKQYNYPGVIVAAIAKSNGADAILAFPPVKEVKDLDNGKLKFVYTADSPSSFLLGLTRTDFGMDNLTDKGPWQHEVAGGSEEVYQLAQQHKGDVFVMWEPEVSKALTTIPNMSVVWDSSKFNGYIEDVIVFHKDFVRDHKSDCVNFMEAYFTAMRTYKSSKANHDRLIKEMCDSIGCKPELAETMMQKIDFHDLQDNCTRQFGISGEHKADGILNCITACVNVLVRTKELQSDPLNDPTTIVDKSILQEVHNHMLADIGNADAVQREFRELTADEWKSLKEIGAMRVEPIDFLQGESELDADAQKQVDAFVKLLSVNYTDARVVVKGHTGPSVDGDDTENVKLSQARADAVVNYLMTQHTSPDGKTTISGLSPNRLRSVGCGSSEPPVRKPGENRLSFNRRKQRVEFVLYNDTDI